VFGKVRGVFLDMKDWAAKMGEPGAFGDWLKIAKNVGSGKPEDDFKVDEDKPLPQKKKKAAPERDYYAAAVGGSDIWKVVAEAIKDSTRVDAQEETNRLLGGIKTVIDALPEDLADAIASDDGALNSVMDAIMWGGQ
jgi:hypothetical protein